MPRSNAALKLFGREAMAIESRDNQWPLDRLWAAGVLLLLAATFRLWIPRRDALSVPMIDGVSAIPIAIKCSILVGMIAAALVAAIVAERLRWTWWLLLICLVASFVIDQQRLQPWAYQTAIYAVVFATMKPSQAHRWLIPLAASVYLYSSAGKLDYQFAYTVGQDFLAILAGPLGGLPESWSIDTRARLALAFPAIEFAIGIALLIRPLRRIAGWSVVGLHTALIAVLGPWALDHSWGVLAWNGLLIVQAWFLFIRPDRDASEASKEAARSMSQESARLGIGQRIARLVVILALLAPLGERAGYWDHWPSWALYSPHNSRADIEIHSSAVDRLDPIMRKYLREDSDQRRWRKIELGRWSLETLGVPIYPQARYQLAVADQIATRHDLGDAIRVVVRGTSNRWTGQRAERHLLGQQEIAEVIKQYWLVGR